MKKAKKQNNGGLKEYEITLIKTDQDSYKHYYNYRKQVDFKDLLRMVRAFKTGGFQVQVEGRTNSARFGF